MRHVLWSIVVAMLPLAVPSPAHAYEETAVADAGVLRGVVRFAGAVPSHRAARGPKRRDACGDQPSEALVIDEDRGVKDAVIRIHGVARGKKNTAELTLDNERCAFVPRVAAVMAGSRARVRNSDGFLHGARGDVGGETVFNVAVPDKGQEVDITRRLATPAVVRVLCEAHPSMRGWVVVHDSPYVTTTDEHGAFSIDGIPPGTYTVTLWHAGFREKGVDRDGRPVYDAPTLITRKVTIAPRASATLEFEMR